MSTLIIQFLLSVSFVFAIIGMSFRAVNRTERELLEEMNLQLRIRELTKAKF